MIALDGRRAKSKCFGPCATLPPRLESSSGLETLRLAMSRYPHWKFGTGMFSLKILNKTYIGKSSLNLIRQGNAYSEYNVLIVYKILTLFNCERVPVPTSAVNEKPIGKRKIASVV